MKEVTSESPCCPSQEEMCAVCMVAARHLVSLEMCSWGTWVRRTKTVFAIVGGRVAEVIQPLSTRFFTRCHLACGCLLSFVFGWKTLSLRFSFYYKLRKPNSQLFGLCDLLAEKSLVPEFISSTMPQRRDVLGSLSAYVLGCFLSYGWPHGFKRAVTALSITSTYLGYSKQRGRGKALWVLIFLFYFIEMSSFL